MFFFLDYTDINKLYLVPSTYALRDHSVRRKTISIIKRHSRQIEKAMPVSLARQPAPWREKSSRLVSFVAKTKSRTTSSLLKSRPVQVFFPRMHEIFFPPTPCACFFGRASSGSSYCGPRRSRLGIYGTARQGCRSQQRGKRNAIKADYGSRSRIRSACLKID